MRSARTAAVLTWIYAAAFGIPAVPVALYLLDRGVLPRFMDAFAMYGGPWSSGGMRDETFAILLAAFFLVTVGTAIAAWSVWRGSRSGAVACLALLGVGSVFWFGFALPIPLLLGFAALVFLVAGWKALR